MLIDLGQPTKVVIATPTKTGTDSLNASLKPSLEFILPKHRSFVPDTIDTATDIHMMIRNPYARLVSAFRYLRKGTFQWAQSYAETSFDAFLDYYLWSRENRPVLDWTRTYSEFLYDLYESLPFPDEEANLTLWDIRAIPDLLKYLDTYHGVEYRPDLHRNKAKEVKPWTAVWTKRRLKKLGDTFASDCELGGYERLSL